MLFSGNRLANELRISRRRGAWHQKALKSPRSRAPKAVGLHARVGRDAAELGAGTGRP